MSPKTQAKVLRLLQDGRFERVGGNQTISTDVRIIAATNRHLENMVADGSFRLDLLYRLNTFTIRLPALRDRIGDLEELAKHFIKSFNQQLGKSVSSLSQDTIDAMRAHAWPGNVRELQSAIKFALVHSVGDVLMPDSLPNSCSSSESMIEPSSVDFNLVEMIRNLIQVREPDIYRKVVDEVERILLREVLDSADGNQVRASQMLGISRTTLRSKMGLGSLVADR